MTTATFRDGTFSFWAACDSEKAVIFRVRKDTTPVKRFKEKSEPGFNRGEAYHLREATPDEVNQWLESHPDFIIIPKS